MRAGRIVVAVALMVAGYAMANAVDAGVTRGWPGWERSLWAGTLLGATGRPWWLYASVRRVRWFALIQSDRAMRVVLAALGITLILAGMLMKV